MITYHADLIQGSDEWLAARCGLLTASEMKLIVTATLKPAMNDRERAHLYELLAQRITQHVEPHYIGEDQLRGYDDEIEARNLYAENYAPVQEMGFITNDRWGFTLGCSPDGLVGDAGMIECKSRRQKYQMQTLVESIEAQTVPDDYLVQVQTALLVSEREWLDFISYSGGMPMATIRVFPNERVQSAILDAAFAFEKRLSEKMDKYREALASDARLIPTKRRVEMEIMV